MTPSRFSQPPQKKKFLPSPTSRFNLSLQRGGGATSPLGKGVGQKHLGQVRAKQDDAFNTMWSLIVSTDKFCQVTSLPIEKLTTTSCRSSWLEALCQLPVEALID